MRTARFCPAPSFFLPALWTCQLTSLFISLEATSYCIIDAGKVKCLTLVSPEYREDPHFPRQCELSGKSAHGGLQTATAMLTHKTSIRGKITFGYYAIVAMVVGLSIITLYEIDYIEKKIVFGEGVHDLFDAALEIRRYEKNYFLFEDEADFRGIIRSVDQAQSFLTNRSKNIDAVAIPEQIDSLNELFNKYRDLTERHFEVIINVAPDGPSNDARKTMFENRIRDAGDRITTLARKIQKNERKGIVDASHTTGNLVIVSIAVLSLVVIVFGQILSRIVVKPLQLIEQNMELIASGGFETIQIESSDQEIVSLTTAFNKMLRELETRQRHLVQSEKLASLGTLLSGVAHELNNPLSNISSSNQILMEELQESQGTGRQHSAQTEVVPFLDPAFALELIGQINDQTDRARNIVRSLLDFSRSRDFQRERLSLKNLLEETIQFVKGQVPTKIEISVTIADDLVLFADKQRIQQTFLNLLKNAIEAVTDEGTITIRAWQHKAADKSEVEGGINYLRYQGKCTIDVDSVDIEIQDTGMGIAPEVLPKIFDPFFTTKDVGKGSGLGLFIVHEIIEEHDGCIAVDSAPGKGTAFLIRLPQATGS